MRAEISKQIEDLCAERGDMVPVGEIGEIVDGILNSLNGDLTGGDIKLYHEIQGLAEYIESAKSEIATIRPQDIGEEHIQVATDELDAIVSHTEEATGTILDAAEKLELLADKLDDANAAVLRDAVTNIYESCNFQDITGQRITRVVSALKDIEAKVMAIVETFADQPGMNTTKMKNTQNKADKAPSKPDDADLLNGPQLADVAQSQEDIDALFDSMK